jgi:hypothetical protein
MAQPVIDYTAKDFAGFQNALLSYAQVAMPQWTAQTTGDFGMLLVDMVSYVGDILSYYEDRAANESFLATATLRESVLQLAALLGYTPAPALAATTTVTITSDPSTTAAITVPAATQLVTGFVAALDGVITFETDTAVTVPAAGGSVNVNVTQGITAGTYQLTAQNGSTYTVADLGVSTGAADQVYTLPKSPLLDGTLTVLIQLPAGAVVWEAVADLLTAAATDTVYSTSLTDTGATQVIFGDGVNGAIPPSGCTISAAYRVGGGAYGNVAANAIVDIAATVTGVSVASSLAASGGADAESLASIRANAPRAWKTQQRAITLQDYADAALAIPAVDKASSTAGAMGAVTVYILAAAAQTPTATLVSQVQKALTPIAAAGSTVTVQAGTTIPVNIGSATSPVTLVVQPTYDRATVLTAVTQALQSMLAPDNVDLGMTIPLSSVYAAIDAVPGVSLVNIPVFARNDIAQNAAYDQYFRVYEMPVAGTITINASGGS